MLIDIHAHAFKYPQIIPPAFCTPEQLIKRWDELGIAKGVVQPIVSPECYMPQTNEDVLEMAQMYPDRIIPFCNVDPRANGNSPYADFTPILQHYKDLGCKGIGEVMPKLDIQDPKVQNLLYHAEKVGMSVTFDGSFQRDVGFGVYDDPGLPQLEMTLISFPNLIIFGHGPWFWGEIAKLETVAEKAYFYTRRGDQVGNMNLGPIKEEGVMPKLMRKYPNLYCELSDCSPYMMLSRDEDYGSAFLTEFQDRTYFGTDLVGPRMKVEIIDMLADWKNRGLITKEVYDKITYINAAKFLGLNELL